MNVSITGATICFLRCWWWRRNLWALSGSPNVGIGGSSIGGTYKRLQVMLLEMELPNTGSGGGGGSV